MSITHEPWAPVELSVEPRIARGMCYAMFAYDIGLSIDLEACERRITALKQRATIRHKRRSPTYFEYRPAPLRVTQEAEPLALGDYYSGKSVDTVLYDFGAVSVTYRIPLTGTFSRLLTLSDDLYDNVLLLKDAQQRVEQLLAVIEAAVVRPHIADFSEDYTIFQIEAFSPPCKVDELISTHTQAIAQILRFEDQALSEQEVHDALSCRIAFGLEDVTIIDWNAAFLFDRDADDVLAVLEFANVELLEMRYLDDQLDDALDQAYEALSSHPRRRLRLPGASTADMHLVAQMQVDSAILFEGVNNALKLLGDQYLARLYRLASQRFHLEEWDASIIRKLHTLESIYGKIADRSANWRLELLEWIIVVLIAVSIILPFILGAPLH
jgi:hypothetical protein